MHLPLASALATFGQGLMILSLASVTLAFWLAILSLRRKDEALAHLSHLSSVTFSVVTIVAYAALIYAFFTHDFSISYVARYSERAMPAFYLFCAGWGGQDGSLLFWTFLMAVLSLIALHQVRSSYKDLHPAFLAVISTAQLFFCIITFFAADPFGVLPEIPLDGKGLNPLLQTPVMAIHPPNLYLGLITFYIPFSLGIAAMISGKMDNRWLIASRNWTLVCWAFLTLGNLLGAYWAYNELGWGGFWAWDPVENASFLPWLTATAFLHSAMIQERQGMMKVWNMSLLIVTYFLTIFGTFLTRSGLISSIHAFARSDIGAYFVVYLVLILVVSFGLMIYRRKDLASQNQLHSPISREASFLINNALFAIATFIVLLGTTYPLLREYTSGTKATVGPPFFNKAMSPIALGLLVLLGICPLLGWRKVNLPRFFQLLIVPLILGTLGGISFGLSYTFAGPGDPDSFTRIGASMIAGLCVFVFAVFFVEIREEVLKRRKHKDSLGWFFLTFRYLVGMRRRYGGYLVHIGVVFAFLGFAGYGFRLEKAAALGEGELMPLGQYLVRFQKLEAFQDAQKKMYEATLQLYESETKDTYDLLEGKALKLPSGATVLLRQGHPSPSALHTAVFEIRVPGQRPLVSPASQAVPLQEGVLRFHTVEWASDSTSKPLIAKADLLQPGRLLTTMLPSRHKFHKHAEPTTEVALETRLMNDIYAILVTWEAEPGKPLLAHFKFYLNPLVFWLWFGGGIMLLGVTLAGWPKRRRKGELAADPDLESAEAIAGNDAIYTEFSPSGSSTSKPPVSSASKASSPSASSPHPAPSGG